MQSLGCHPQLISNLLDRFVRLGDQAQSFSLKLRTVTLLPFATSHNGLLRRILRPKGVHNNGSTPILKNRSPFLRCSVYSAFSVPSVPVLSAISVSITQT